MHEGAIAQSLLNLANLNFHRSGLKKITRVKVVIGKLHNVIDEVLVMHFDLLKRDMNGFREAILEIEKKEVVIKCMQCGMEKTLNEVDFTCSSCESTSTEVTSGNELHIECIEGTED
ncbi:MAG: hydrogenase maturation nickel metallochaperone HypA [Candidatus Cloacimonetes bacterium]|nr:hydrogenase maturation nickel metallochaperone HypA [Candidatus Cloacimonadota bacterium]